VGGLGEGGLGEGGLGEGDLGEGDLGEGGLSQGRLLFLSRNFARREKQRFRASLMEILSFYSNIFAERETCFSAINLIGTEMNNRNDHPDVDRSVVKG
jgi:hypothetical protein